MATLSSRYGIYQWQGSDPVKREEINHNFTVLEQELYTRRTFQPLVSVTNSVAVQMVSIDVSEVDWDEYHEVILEIWYPSKVTTEGRIYVNQLTGAGSETYGCTMSPPSSMSYMTVEESLGRIGGHRGRFKIIANQHASAELATELRSLSGTRPYIGWKTDITLSEITSIDYYNYNKVPVGTEFTVLGVK